MKTKTIHISKKVLALREDAINIKKEADKASSDISIDFSEVHFFSRAFSDELLNVMEALKAEGKKIHLKKINPNIKKMLQLVKDQRRRIIQELKQNAGLGKE